MQNADCNENCNIHVTCVPMSDWEELSFWGRFTDRDPRRPEKTWKNRFFWTWPIHVIKGGLTNHTAPRFKIGRNDPRVLRHGIKYLDIRTTKFEGETHEHKPLSRYYRVFWYGWNWGWR